MAKNRGEKGGKFEREICKKLSLWWTGGENDSVFWRTPSSGGRATTRKKKGKEDRLLHGDITFTDPIGEPFCQAFCVELKKGYSDESILDLFDRRKKSSYKKWLDKLEDTRATCGALSIMLIHQRDRRNAMVYVASEMFRQLCHPQLPGVWPFLEVKFCGRVFYHGCTLDDFLTHFTPQDVQRAALCFPR